MEELLTEVPAQLQRTLETLQQLQKRLDVEMNSGLAASAGAGVNPNHVTMATKLADASTKLGREVRAWSKKVVEAGRQAPLEERKEAVLRFILSLPHGERLEMYSNLQSGEKELPDTVRLHVRD